MSQYIIETSEGPQSDALITFLRSLGYIRVRPVQNPSSTKTQAIADMNALLKELPTNKPDQQEINRAIKSIRRKGGYQ